MPTKKERQNNFFDVCSLCRDSCCRNARPPTTEEREKIIEAYLKKKKIPIKNPFIHAAYTFPKEDAEGYCIFYDKKMMMCIVHPVKPETCVAGPITFDINKANEKIEWHLKKEKICRLAGALYTNGDALKKHLESAKREIITLVNQLDSEALKAILKIEEPETIKIAEDKIGNHIMDKLASNT